MRQQRIRKGTRRRRPLLIDASPIPTGSDAGDTSGAADVLDRIDQILEVL
jgi:hypothetical protein